MNLLVNVLFYNSNFVTLMKPSLMHKTTNSTQFFDRHFGKKEKKVIGLESRE